MRLSSRTEVPMYIPSISSDSLRSSIFPQDDKEHFCFISLPHSNYLPSSVLYKTYVSGFQNLTTLVHPTLAWGTTAKGRQDVSVCEPVLSQAGWKAFAETLENPEDQCEFSFCDSCLYHLPQLGTCPLSCPGAAVAWGQGSEPVIYLDVFSPSPLPPRCLGPLVPTQPCFWFGPTEGPVAAGARAWHSELEAWALTISW